MTERQKFNIAETKERLFKRDGYLCSNCGRPLYVFNTPQLAHRIAKTKANILKYGESIIHHDLNLASCCGLKCNAALNAGVTGEQQVLSKIKGCV